jgi:hypothetical protein
VGCAFFEVTTGGAFIFPAGRTSAMSWIRDFSAREGHLPPLRNVDDSAPDRMRQELVDAFYVVANGAAGGLDADRDLYLIIEQSLGVQAAGNPQSGRRQRVGRDIASAEWQRVYDLIVRLWVEFRRVGLHEVYRENVNRILAAHGVVWDLGADAHLHRVMPPPVTEQVTAVITELNQPQFEPARLLFNAAREAFDARPRRDRDSCSNAFDALESIAKVRFGMPDAAFGQVLVHLRQNDLLNGQVLGILEAINTLRNRNFGHGMVAPFALCPEEVDFTYLSCLAGILLFARHR